MDAKDKRIAELEERLQAALEKNVVLEARIAQLEKHSGNSSKPLASDIPTSDIVKPPKPRKDKDRRHKIGAQRGHKAHQRQPFADDQIDQTIELKLECCWAHLIREVKYLAERKVKKVSCYGNRLLGATQNIFSTIHRRGKIVDRTWFRRMYCHRDEILKVAWRRMPVDNDVANIAERLWNDQDDYFRFIFQFWDVKTLAFRRFPFLTIKFCCNQSVLLCSFAIPLLDCHHFHTSFVWCGFHFHTSGGCKLRIVGFQPTDRTRRL